MTLQVNEIFETVQGEATWTGTPSVFVRLQGCEVGCPWCDTKHTWAVDKDREISIMEMLEKEKDADTYASIDESELCDLIAGYRARHVVITGGEPCLYDLRNVTTRITMIGKSVQIETSGTQPIRCSGETFVTVSPKIDMPGGFQVLDECLNRANEIKMPVGKLADVEKLTKLLMRVNWSLDPVPTIWLQPLSTNEKATALCVREATTRGYRISIQTHKYLGVR